MSEFFKEIVSQFTISGLALCQDLMTVALIVPLGKRVSVEALVSEPGRDLGTWRDKGRLGWLKRRHLRIEPAKRTSQ